MPEINSLKPIVHNRSKVLVPHILKKIALYSKLCYSYLELKLVVNNETQIYFNWYL
ncbi:MAG: hypothetical protein K0R54_3478 [Clostridiaceae bacterium]|jgi:hypothetical protein|nr:hypothetical protein [Clostridiaceae bacterium]